MSRPLYSQLVPYYEVVEGRDWKREVNLVASILREHKCKSLIDLGCGTGYHVIALTKIGFNATGIDISKQNIEFAKKKAKKEHVQSHFVVGSYYKYRHSELLDAALCLNWSIPVTDSEVGRFLNNTYAMLRPEGLLIFDYERVSQIAWNDVGRAISDSWDQRHKLIARVSVGQINKNVLCSRDVYLIYPKLSESMPPNEKARYGAADRSNDVQIYLDRSCVRFFSIAEIREFARLTGFKLLSNFMLPRKEYRRSYAVLRKVA
jgi:SAM-dependent methyltransferase